MANLHILKRVPLVAIVLILSELMASAEDDICKGLFDQGYYDTNKTFTTQQNYTYIKNVICYDKTMTYQDATSGAFNLGIPIPDIIDIGIGGKTDANNFSTRRDQFCGTGVSNAFATSSLIHEVKVVSQTAADVMKACLTRYGCHAVIIPSANLRGFTIRIVNIQQGDNTIGKISIQSTPAEAVKCQGVDYTTRYTSPHDFACEKPAEATVQVSMNSDRCDLEPKDVYGTDQTLPDLLNTIQALQGHLDRMNGYFRQIYLNGAADGQLGVETSPSTAGFECGKEQYLVGLNLAYSADGKVTSMRPKCRALFSTGTGASYSYPY